MKTIELKLKLILKKLEKIESLLEDSKSEDINSFISEHEAKKVFKRGTTWFWEQRQCGLQFSKLGGQVFYRKSDLVDMLTKGMTIN